MCDFCQAPPTDGSAPSLAQVRSTFQWLAQQQLTGVKLTGGEPTVRRDIVSIVRHARDLGLTPTLCTNGIRVTDTLTSELVATHAKVKVSLHAPDRRHDQALGVACSDLVIANVRRLRDAGIRISLHTVITRANDDMIEAMIAFCRSEGIRKISFLPFVPRGRGAELATAYLHDHVRRSDLCARIRTLAEIHKSNIDVRLLDFAAKDYYVIESDGRLTIQRDDDATDITLGHVWTPLNSTKSFSECA